MCQDKFECNSNTRLHLKRRGDFCKHHQASVCCLNILKKVLGHKQYQRRPSDGPEGLGTSSKFAASVRARPVPGLTSETEGPVAQLDWLSVSVQLQLLNMVLQFALAPLQSHSGRWEPVCITLRNSKSRFLWLWRSVRQTGSHRPAAAVVHSFPAAKDLRTSTQRNPCPSLRWSLSPGLYPACCNNTDDEERMPVQLKCEHVNDRFALERCRHPRVPPAVRLDLQDKRVLTPSRTEIVSEAFALPASGTGHVAGKHKRCLGGACRTAWACQSPSIKSGKQGASPESKQFNQRVFQAILT